MPTPFNPEPGTRNPESRIAEAAARSFLYHYLARAFDYPTPAIWEWLRDPGSECALRTAAASAGLAPEADALVRQMRATGCEEFQSSYVSSFGHAARGPFPPNEIEYGEPKADPLFQPHRLADLAAFYRAFGLELREECDERQDHIAMELEFMSVLAMKEAAALAAADGSVGDGFAICRDAQKKFLREHLGRWAPAFSRRLSRAWAGRPLGAVAELLGGFVRRECTAFGVRGGSEDLLLRPVDDAVERLCDSCGLAGRLPGAVAPEEDSP